MQVYVDPQKHYFCFQNAIHDHESFFLLPLIPESDILPYYSCSMQIVVLWRAEKIKIIVRFNTLLTRIFYCLSSSKMYSL